MNKDYYWLNQHTRIFLERGYLEEGISPEERVRQIAENAEVILKIRGFADKFESYMAKGWISLSSPIWSNYGNNRGLPCSCNGQSVQDTMESILDNAAETGIMTKTGAGTSAYFGNLRPRGAKITVGGESSGPVHFMEIFNSVSNVVSQSSVRRGSFAAYLNIDHPDIEEFLLIRGEGHPIQDISLGVCISDKWMNEMIEGDKEKRKIWGLVIKKRFETGYPYIFFSDTVNKNKHKTYKDKDINIVASNLCVTGDQRVVSNFGLLTAKELYDIGEELTLFDNKERVKASKMNLIQKDSDVYKITLENGMSHSITNYHKLIRRLDVSRPSVDTIEKVECKNLRIGDYIAIQTEKGIFGQTHMPEEAFLLGLYQADGTQSGENIHLCLWENDFDLIEEVQHSFNYIYEKYDSGNISIENQYGKTNGRRRFDPPTFHDCNTGFSLVKKKALISRCLKKALNFEKGYIPNWIWESNEETQWQYIRGLYYADGTVNVTNGKGSPLYLSITSINKSFLQELQLLLANLGIKANLHKSSEAGQTLLPDGRGGKALYDTKESYRLVTGNKNDAIIFEEKTGFLSRKGIVLDSDKYRDNSKKFSKIKSIEYIGKEDVYCVEVYNNRHLWVCNGFITHNCSETCIPAGDDFSFVCVLSSLNLLHYDEWKDTDLVETMTYFLDSVTEEYIKKTKDIKHLQKARKFAKEHRSVGLGVLGWHSYLQSKMIPFESMEAKFLNGEIFELINKKSLQASKALAERYGEPKILEGYGERMTTRLAVAPTTSSSFILGQVSPSIEALNSNFFVKKLAKGSFTYKNPYLKEVLKKYDKNDDPTWKSILVHGGSVQHLKFLTQEEKDVFKTFGEISPKEVVIQAIQRQKYIDQSQSLNLMIPPDAKPKEVSELLIYGFQNGIKTYYYQRSSSPSQQLVRSILTCASCEA